MKRYALALWQALRHFDERDGIAASANVAMALLLAMFPFLIFVVSVASILSADVDPSALVELVLGSWPKAVADPILNEVYAVLDQSDGGTLGTGLFLAIFFASNGIDAVRRALANAYRDSDPRPFWQSRISSLLFVLIGALVLITVATLQIGIPLFLDHAGEAIHTDLSRLLDSDLLRGLVTGGVLTFAVLACHMRLPAHQQPLRLVLPGVILTLVLWYIAGRGFGFYLANLADYSVTYAGLAGIMATLIFLNLMAAIFILGAEFNGELGAFPRGSADRT